MLLLFIYCDLLNIMVMYFQNKLSYHHYFYQGYFQIKNVSSIISFTIERINFTQSDLKAKSKVITMAKHNKSNIVTSQRTCQKQENTSDQITFAKSQLVLFLHLIG